APRARERLDPAARCRDAGRDTEGPRLADRGARREPDPRRGRRLRPGIRRLRRPRGPRAYRAGHAHFAQTYYGDGLVGVRLGRMKYVFKPRQAEVAERPRESSEPPGSSAAREELYDLEDDPAETTD